MSKPRMRKPRATIKPEMVEEWRGRCERWLAANTKRSGTDKPATLDDVQTGAGAWEIAHRTNIVFDAYHKIKGVQHAHIEMALRRIFPRATFKDR